VFSLTWENQESTLLQARQSNNFWKQGYGLCRKDLNSR
jgi:hypothetical protein